MKIDGIISLSSRKKIDLFGLDFIEEKAVLKISSSQFVTL